MKVHHTQTVMVINLLNFTWILLSSHIENISHSRKLLESLCHILNSEHTGHSYYPNPILTFHWVIFQRYDRICICLNYQTKYDYVHVKLEFGIRIKIVDNVTDTVYLSNHPKLSNISLLLKMYILEKSSKMHSAAGGNNIMKAKPKAMASRLYMIYPRGQVDKSVTNDAIL